MLTTHTPSTSMKNAVNRIYEYLLASTMEWAQREESIRAVIQVGSRARQDNPADEWADLDLMFYTTTPELYIDNIDWIETIAPVWLKVQSRTAGGDPEYLVIYEGGYSVDFVFCPAAWLTKIPSNDPLFQRGACILLDRDGLATKVVPQTPSVPAHQPPSKADFDSLCDAFWYLSIYIARQIRRGDLWLVKARDTQQKECLLRLMEWQSGCMSQWTADTWHNGRFIDQWADSRVLSEINQIFGGYSVSESSDALLASTSLFCHVAQEVAACSGFVYSHQTEARSMMLIHEALGDL